MIRVWLIEMCDFLGLPAVDVDLRYRKISPGRLVDLIDNLDEIRDCLSPTRFAWMLVNGFPSFCSYC